MIEINLLPKNYQKKSLDFSLGKSGFYIIGGVAAVLVMLVAIAFYQTHQLTNLQRNIDNAGRRQAMLEKDIRMVDALTDVKGKLEQRMKAVEKLDSHRSSWVRVLEDLAQNVPDFVWLGTFEEINPEAEKDAKDAKGAKKAPAKEAETATAPATTNNNPMVQKAKLEGYAFTLNALAAFMIKMMRSDYFDEVELVSTNEISLDDNKAYDFVLTFNIHYLSDEELRNLIAAADEKAESQNAKTSHSSLN